jgi:hypothetical protein
MMGFNRDMNLPDGISVNDAKALIVNAEQSIFDGRAVTNRKLVWKQCKTCYVKYSPNQATCPKCAGVPPLASPSVDWRWERTKELLHTLALCAAGMAIIGLAGMGCMKLFEWLF